MTVEFGVRPQCDLETTQELRCCSERVPLSDVGRDRECGTTDLIDEREVLTQAWVQAEEVGAVRNVLGDVPSIETLELSHDDTVRDVRWGDGTRTMLGGDVFTHPASRIPHLASRP